jgi:hypothetical protein
MIREAYGSHAKEGHLSGVAISEWPSRKPTLALLPECPWETMDPFPAD